MSADRPLAARYKELVFPDEVWSPTVSQVLALIETQKGQPVKDDLLEALAASFPPKIGNVTKELMQTLNDASTENRHAIKEAFFEVLRLNIVNCPNYVSTREAKERSNLLVLALAQVGLEMISEI